MRDRRRSGLQRLILAAAVAVTAMAMVMTPVAATAATRLETTEEAYWDAAGKGTAYWKKVDHAWEYQVRLYEDGDRLVATTTTKGLKADLHEYMKDGTTYVFSVRGVPNPGNRTYLSGDWKTSDFLDMEGLGESGGRWRTYSQGKKYQREDNSYITGQWGLVQGSWYYFDQEGFARTGWQQIGSQWYYLDGEGVMKTGWLELDGIWYYLNSDGSMATGWKQVKPGEWYYMDGSGRMLADTVIDGYQLDHSGRWIS